MARPACGEALYENGALIGACLQPYGVEHQHCDEDATVLLARGLVQPLTAWETYPADVLVMGDEIAQINFTGLDAVEHGVSV